MLDEPLVGMDRASRTSLLKLLDDFCHDQNKTIFMISHDIAAMRQTAHRMIYLEETIRFDGPPPISRLRNWPFCEALRMYTVAIITTMPLNTAVEATIRNPAFTIH